MAKFSPTVQVVEAFRPGQQLGLADALGELVPGNHRLDGGIGVAAAFLRFQQRTAVTEYRRTLSLIALPCFWNCC